MIGHGMAVWLGYWFFARQKFPLSLNLIATAIWLVGVGFTWSAWFGGWL